MLTINCSVWNKGHNHDESHMFQGFGNSHHLGPNLSTDTFHKIAMGVPAHRVHCSMEIFTT